MRCWLTTVAAHDWSVTVRESAGKPEDRMANVDVAKAYLHERRLAGSRPARKNGF